MTRALRSELLKMRTVPGMWVVLLLAFPLTCLFILFAFINAGNHADPKVTFAAVSTLSQRRLLLAAGFRAVTLLAPVLGVLCITTEYRHKTVTGTLLLTPKRDVVLGAKIIATTIWCVGMAAITFVAVGALGLSWNAAMGGTVSSVLDQAGAVLPQMFAVTVLLGLFGLGFGTLVKNQIAGVLVTIGESLILEGLIVLLFLSVFHYDLNWLPGEATAAFAGILAKGASFGGSSDSIFTLLSWWTGGLVMLGWGLGPLAIGYFTTFRRDVT
jgi:ABC-type transport system involved in multi-copper enzyme maturation permease subunit